MAHFLRGGAGGNRTPVHQPVDEPATTIPVPGADAAPPAGRLTTRCGGPRSVFPEGQRSFLPSAVFPAVIPRFCCRAAVEWPRATFLLTMSLRSPEDQAARANCSSAILVGAPFYESEQLGSHARPASLTSKPVSPVVRASSQPTGPAGASRRRSGGPGSATARSIAATASSAVCTATAGTPMPSASRTKSRSGREGRAGRAPSARLAGAGAGHLDVEDGVGPVVRGSPS